MFVETSAKVTLNSKIIFDLKSLKNDVFVHVFICLLCLQNILRTAEQIFIKLPENNHCMDNPLAFAFSPIQHGHQVTLNKTNVAINPSSINITMKLVVISGETNHKHILRSLSDFISIDNCWENIS